MLGQVASSAGRSGGKEISAKEAKEIDRLRTVAKGTSDDTKRKYGLNDEDIVVLCKYKQGALLDLDDLEMLLPLVFSMKQQIQQFPQYHYKKVGLEISSDWEATRSRIAIDEGVRKMYIAIPVKARADYARWTIKNSPFMYTGFIEVYEGYGMDIELPTKVDFIIYEPTPEAAKRRQLSTEDNFCLKLIKEKHLTDPEAWNRVLFV
mmetsp:Transcript_22579/g.57156  ORF Transcript_22579/g.57156 Transcript_22579/m.57156 type:complete len:206 (+) Transcript_22579:304-921(+)|eukprot:g19966.t1